MVTCSLGIVFDWMHFGKGKAGLFGCVRCPFLVGFHYDLYPLGLLQQIFLGWQQVVLHAPPHQSVWTHGHVCFMAGPFWDQRRSHFFSVTLELT